MSNTEQISVAISANETINIYMAAVSENALLLTWPEKICPKQHQHITLCQQQINQQLTALVFESIASYNSLMLYYHFDQISVTDLKKQLRAICQQVTLLTPDETDLAEVSIPVYYGEDAGWDLAWVAEQCQLSQAEVIALHSQQTYHAYALGFTPGFCYLGQLDDRLALPRRASPRVSIPMGAVAIAEKQTAVYPNQSPGGWHIIGQTPLPMYTVSKPEISIPQKMPQEHTFAAAINVGQKVTFNAISYQEFLALGGTLAVEPKQSIHAINGKQ